jgi:hypothetical protein
MDATKADGSCEDNVDMAVSLCYPHAVSDAAGVNLNPMKDEDRV